MNKNLVILLTIFLISSCNQNQKTETKGWQLIYQNDNSGNDITGNKTKLRVAIESGCKVRVGWSVKLKNNKEIKHLTDAYFISIHNNEIFAQVESIMRQIPESHHPIINLDTLDNRKWYAIIATTGEMRSVFSGIQKNRIRRIGSSWYINENNCSINSNSE